MAKNKILIFGILLFFCYSSFGADEEGKKIRRFSLQADYFQTKDDFNYGLVIHGMNLSLGYEIQKFKNDKMLSYSSSLAFGPGYRQGLALNWEFKPIDIYYGYKIQEKNDVFLGGFMSSNYHWQLYPELQSGHLFWFSSLEFGPRLHAKINIGSRNINLSFSNSLIGLASRPTPSTEQYFYSLKFSDFVNKPHSNIKFGSLNLMNHTNFKIEFPNSKGKRLNLAYVFNYFGYYKEPSVDYITHSFNLTWLLGKSKQS